MSAKDREWAINPLVGGEFRPLKESELGLAEAFVKKAFQHIYGETATADSIEAHLHRFTVETFRQNLKNSSEYWGAFYKGALAAATEVRASGLLNWYYLDPVFNGTGLGRRLIVHVVQHLAESRPELNMLAMEIAPESHQHWIDFGALSLDVVWNTEDGIPYYPMLLPFARTRLAACFPLPDYAMAKLPPATSIGAFNANRGDRLHAGLDLYCKADTPVCSVLSGVVTHVGAFSSPTQNSYWKRTQQVLVNHGGFLLRYAELGELKVEVGQKLAAGSFLGSVGQILDSARVDKRAPEYIQQLVREDRCSMLHLELWSRDPLEAERYSGGNFFGPLPQGVGSPRSMLEWIQSRRPSS